MKIKSSKFTIYEVEELHKEFLSQLKELKPIEVDLTNVTKIDMPAIGLLISTMKSCKADSIPFSISNISAEVKQSLKISGCDSVLGVDND